MNIELVPRLIDPSHLAERSAKIKGDLSLSGFDRLAELVGKQDNSLVIQVDFGYDDHGRCLVSGGLHTSVQLTCQRCMEFYQHKVSSQFNVVPLSTEAEAKLLEDETEYVLMNDGQIRLVDLLEEELILNLPMIAKHGDNHAECIPKIWHFSTSESEEEIETAHPFKILEALKNK